MLNVVFSEEYYTMKKQWSTMSEKQLDNFSALKERLHLIGKIDLAII